MVLELTNLPKNGGDKITIVIPPNAPVLLDCAVNSVGDVVGTRLVIAGLVSIVCMESYEVVKGLLAKGLGGGIVSGVKNES